MAADTLDGTFKPAKKIKTGRECRSFVLLLLLYCCAEDRPRCPNAQYDGGRFLDTLDTSILKVSTQYAPPKTRWKSYQTSGVGHLDTLDGPSKLEEKNQSCYGVITADDVSIGSAGVRQTVQGVQVSAL